jgi:hypothetical protein
MTKKGDKSMRNKSILLILALLSLLAYLSATDFSEDFQNDEFPPTGWVNDGWSKYQPMLSTEIAAQATSAMGDKWLITPQILLDGNNNLEFQVRDAADAWDNTNEYLRIAISTTDTDYASFTILDSLDSSETGMIWKDKSYNLSAYAGQNVYIAFHRHAAGGNSVRIDNVSIVPPSEYAVEAAIPVNQQIFTVGVPGTFDINISNNGVNDDTYDLSVSSSATWTYEFINADNNVITSYALASGDNGSVRLKVTIPSGTANNASETVDVTVTSQADNTISDAATITTYANAPQAVPYIEDFEDMTLGLSDLGWSGNFMGSTAGIMHGFNGSQGIYKRLTAQTFSGEAITDNVTLTGSNLGIQFDYRFMKDDDYPFTAEPLELGDTLAVEISANGGEFVRLATITEHNHTTTTNFTPYMVEIPESYENQIVKIQFYATWGANIDRIYVLDIDNVKVIELPANDVEVKQMGILTGIDPIMNAGDAVTIVSQIFNAGHEDRSNVVVDFKLDGASIGTETITSLEAGKSEDISFDWTVAAPSSRSSHELTVSVIDDDNNTNNSLEQSIVIYADGALIESFEGTIPPTGWLVDDDSWVAQNYGAVEGSQYVQIATNKSGKLVTPKLDIVDGDVISFIARRGYFGGDLVIKYSEDLTTWEDLVTIDTLSSATFNEQTIDLSPLAGTPKYLAFYKDDAGFVKLDYVRGPKVWVAPTPEFFVSVTDLEYNQLPLDAPSVKPVVIKNIGNGDLTINSIAFEDDAEFSFTPAFTAPIVLSENEADTIYVQADADNVGDFTTNLVITDDISSREAHTIPVHAEIIDTKITGDFTEGFEGELFPPLGWEANLWSRGAEAHSGDYSARASWMHDNPAVLVTPVMNLPENYRIRFWWKDDDISAPSRVIGNDTTFVDVLVAGEWNEIAELQTTEAMTEYAEFAINLSAYANQDIQLRFRDHTRSASTSYGIGIDDITLEVAPVLPKPANLAATLVEDTNVRLTWDAPTFGDTLTLTSYKIYRNGFYLTNSTIDSTVFIDENRPNGDHEYKISAVYGIDESGKSDPVTVSINHEPLNTPTNFSAVVANANDVTLSWDVPAMDIKSLNWDDGAYAISVGVNDTATFDVAVRFTGVDLADYSGDQVSSIAFFPTEENCTYRVRIWQGGNYAFAYNPGNMIVDQAVATPIIGQWNIATLDTPVAIDPSQELWIGYQAETLAGLPIGGDAGPTVAEKGDLVSINGGAWASLSAVNSDFNCNWNVAGILTEATSDAVANTNIIAKDKNVSRNVRNASISLNEVASDAKRFTRTSRATLTGYKIFRDNEVLVELDDPAATTYQDNDLPTGPHAYYMVAVYGDQISEQTNTVNVVTVGNENIQSYTTELNDNYPNPFNPTTEISYSLKKSGPVSIRIFNVKGQVVKTLVNEDQSAGTHSVTWKGSDNSGKDVSSGVYFYRMTAKDYKSTKKMMLMK